MILKRIYEDRLAQASFLLGCSDSGQAIVIDPNRDVERYINAARAEGLRITCVTETHIHADFVSGSRELAGRTGATVAVSGDSGPDWQYAFAGEQGVRVLHDGDSIHAGKVRLDVRHTPGHTPEHVTFLLTDEATSPEPIGAFTGDFIFAGDVGRPDLLERAAGMTGTMESGARQLYASLQSFSELPDRLLLWPGHGPGSACGKQLGGMPVTTLGYEKLANWAFQTKSESEFVEKVLQDQPDPPRYFAEMKRVNKLGADSVEPAPAHISLGDLPEARRRSQIQVIDLRPSTQFAQGFVPGTVSIPLNKSFLNWSGALLDARQEIYLIGEEPQVREATAALHLIGLDRVRGWLSPRELVQPLGTTEQVPVAETLHRQKQGQVVLDVRSNTEFREGHIPGAVHIPLGRLPEEASLLRRDTGIVVHCQGGGRASIAASVLRRLGFDEVANYGAGFADYQRQGLPVETGETAEAQAVLPRA